MAKEDISLSGLRNRMDELLLGKVNIEAGKRLSTNDFTNEYKNTIDELVQINSDTPPIPVITEPGLVLKSTDVAGQYLWQQIEVYDHSKMTTADKNIHLSDDDKNKLAKMVDISHLHEYYYTKGETTAEIYKVIQSYTNSSSLLSTITQINQALQANHNNMTLAEYLVNEIDNKVEKELVQDGSGNYKVLSDNNFSNIYRAKLDNLSNYNLPTASFLQLGGVRVGQGLLIDENGLLTPDVNDVLVTKQQLSTLTAYSLPAASTNELGGIKLPSDGSLVLNDNNELYVNKELLNDVTSDFIENIANIKLDKASIYYGVGVFRGAGITTNILTNDSGKNVKFCMLTPIDGLTDFGRYWYTINQNNKQEVTVYNSGAEGTSFTYVLFLED